MAGVLRARTRLAFVVTLTFACGFARGAPLYAQTRQPHLEVFLPPPAQLAQIGPLIAAHDMLSTARTKEPLASGFPARLHFLVELWSEGGLTNEVQRRAEYDVLVTYSAMEKKYRVDQLVNERTFSLGKFDRVEDAEGAVARPTRVPIKALHSSRRFYYRVTLDVEILNSSDLDEVNRWLKGDLKPAFKGERDPGTTLARSFRRLASKLLGGGTTQYEARSPDFIVP